MPHSGEAGIVDTSNPSHGSDAWAKDDDTAALRSTVFGAHLRGDRAPRILGLFAHPDDEVFCVGGTIARCAAAGAVTAIASLTEGEAGQIRDAAAATRRTLGTVRVKELEASAAELGVDQVTCLDLGDGRLTERPVAETAAAVRGLIDEFAPDTVVTFGPDGGSGHPDHVASCAATRCALRTMAEPPRLLHASFPMRGALMVDTIVEWLVSRPRQQSNSLEAAHALRLFADGTSMLGVAADHVRVEWYPPGSFIIEQDEPATELFCLLSGTADVVVERVDGSLHSCATVGVGGFVGEDGLFSGRPRNAHVIARESVTCLVLSRLPPSSSAGRGCRATKLDRASTPHMEKGELRPCEPGVAVDVRATLHRKVAALAAHRSQFALDAELLPMPVLEKLLGSEHFVVAAD